MTIIPINNMKLGNPISTFLNKFPSQTVLRSKSKIKTLYAVIQSVRVKSLAVKRHLPRNLLKSYNSKKPSI